MVGETTWIKPAKVKEPMSVVLESAKANKYEADWQGNKSTRYRIKCQNNIMLDTTGMFVKKMIDAGATDGATMTFRSFVGANNRPDYEISIQNNGMDVSKQSIENVFGKEPVDNYANNNNNTLDAKVNALITRVTAIESKLNSSTEKKAQYDDEIPF